MLTLYEVVRRLHRTQHARSSRRQIYRISWAAERLMMVKLMLKEEFSADPELACIVKVYYTEVFTGQDGL